MIWALIEVVLPMLLTFLFGLLAAWLWWRRGTTTTEGQLGGNGPGANDNSVDGSQLSAGDLSADHDAQQGRFVQEQALAKELNSANASIRSLVAELDVTRTRLQRCEGQLAKADVEESADALQTSGSGPVKSDLDRAPGSDSSIDRNHDSSAVEQLRLLQQQYQELETVQSIDKAELAKKHHLEARLNSLTRELADNKNELLNTKKAASQLQSEVNVLRRNRSAEAQKTVQGISGSRGAGGSDVNDSDAQIAQLKAQIAEIAPAAEQAREYQSQVAALQARLQQSESKVRQIEQSGERIDHLDAQLHSRLADELEKAQQKVRGLELKVGQTAEKSSELVRIRSKVATLESELGEANSRAEDADKLQQRVTALESLLKGSEVKAVNERLVEAEAQLRIANKRVAEQQQQINRLQDQSKASIDPAISSGVSDSADAFDAPEADLRLSSVRRQRGATTAVAGHTTDSISSESSAPAVSQAAAKTESIQPGISRDGQGSTHASGLPAWHAGVTRFGTPAARHKDDLKVIRGIGPVLEKTLNEAEIQTWDQLAALQANEIALIEQSMDFPGRMTRERWVEQATELVALYPETEGRPSGKKLLPKKA